MTIAEARQICKSLVGRIPRDVLIIGIIVLVALVSFGLGYLAGLDAQKGSGLSRTTSPLVETSLDGRVVASKSGTKYHLPWCAGLDRTPEANKVWFNSAAAAEAAGYTPAANCSGL